MKNKMRKTGENALKLLAAVPAFAVAHILAESASAQTFQFQPDAVQNIRGFTVPVDIALLGPNGEATAGFYASLDPFHGRHWRKFSGLDTDQKLFSTDERMIERVFLHMETHGIPRQTLIDLYEKAKKVWDAKPALRINAPQP